MKYILKYIFSLILCSAIANAQPNLSIKDSISAQKESKIIEGKKDSNQKAKETKPLLTQKDSLAAIKKDRYGIRFGVDFYRLSRGFYDKNYKGIELVADYRLTKNYYAAAELGTENKTNDDDRLNTTTKGSYLKVGFDYNGYENWLDMENIISIGLRGGFSNFSQQLNSYKVYNSNPYWGVQQDIPTNQKFDGLTASWIEVVAGLKVKVINNIFVGFSLRMNMLLTNKKPGDFENLYIPGFNRTYAGSFGAGINYTVTYFLPLYKKIVKPKEIKK